MTRLRLWASLLTSSVVALVAIISVLDDRKETEWQRSERWSVSFISISVAFSFFGALSSMLSPQTSMKLELPLIIIVLGFWCAGLPSILDPDRNLAVTPEFAISNANLFFFSYASLIFSLLLLGSWFEQKNGDEASPTAMSWVLLASTSLVVMSSAVNVLREENCRRDGSSFCERTRFGIFGGMSSGMMALCLVVLRKHAPMNCQAVVGFLLLIVWACGYEGRNQTCDRTLVLGCFLSLTLFFPFFSVAYITFGSGPGTKLGSLYFATWSSFFICINLTVTAANEYIRDNNIRIVAGNDDMGDKNKGDDDADDKKKGEDTAAAVEEGKATEKSNQEESEEKSA